MGESNPNPTTAPFIKMLRCTLVHSSVTTASFNVTSRYLPTLLLVQLSTHELVQEPIRPLHLAQLLETHPSPQFINRLLTQLQYGFDIGYQGTHQIISEPSTSHLPQSTWKQLMTTLLWNPVNTKQLVHSPIPPCQLFHCSGMGGGAPMMA